MKQLRVALVPGDGIGPEALAAVQEVLEATLPRFGDAHVLYSEYAAGEDAYATSGDALPDSTLDGIRENGIALIGAINASRNYPSIIGLLRKKLDLYADVRPVKSFSGLGISGKEVDVLCIRENTQGFLADRNLFKGNGEFMPDPDTVLSLRVLTRSGCARIAEFAFGTARRLGRHKVTIVHKSNALPMGCGFFRAVAESVAAKYPEIECDAGYVDDVANGLVTNPEQYDVLLSTNLFGDIVSDVAAGVAGNYVPAANVGEQTIVYFPIHHEGRNAIVGKNIFDPTSHILCAAMMLKDAGLQPAGSAIEAAVHDFHRSLAAERRGIRDVPGTKEITAGICSLLKTREKG
jgi:isocitrate/isopropylmalate dehydrogenase